MNKQIALASFYIISDAPDAFDWKTKARISNYEEAVEGARSASEVFKRPFYVYKISTVATRIGI